jgi:hypothetical protein
MANMSGEVHFNLQHILRMQKAEARDFYALGQLASSRSQLVIPPRRDIVSGSGRVTPAKQFVFDRANGVGLREDAVAKIRPNRKRVAPTGRSKRGMLREYQVINH